MRKLTLEQCREDAQRRGGRCVNERYLGSLQPMEWECAEGHRWITTAHAIRQGHWCKKCADERMRLPQERIADIAASHGGRCLGPYSNTATKMHWRCAQGHEWLATLNAVKQGRWCRECAGKKTPRRARSWFAAAVPTGQALE